MKPGPRSVPPGGNRPSAAARRKRWFVGLGAVSLAALLATAVTVAWEVHRRPGRIAGALPAPPAVEDGPAEFQQRLRAAQQAALDRRRHRESVEALARLYHANGYNDEAEACWRILVQVEPKHPRWHYFLADLKRQAGDYPAMTALLERTTELDPSYAPAWLQLADLRFKTGQLEAAAPAYRQRLALLPGDPYARLGLIRIAQQEGRSEEARRQITQLVADQPAFAPAHNLLAEMLAAESDTDGAERARFRGSEAGRFRPATDPWLDELWDDCFDYEKLCVRGMMDVLTGRVDEGQALFERALTLRPHALTAYELLGNVYLDGHDGARAVETYERGRGLATDAEPSAKFYVHLGRAYRLTNQPAEAVRVLREGLARIGDAFELHDALGQALVELGDVDAAIDAHRAAVARQPQDPAAHHHLALALIAAHRLEEAVAELHHAHALNPSYPPTLALLGQIEMDSGRWQQAVRYLQPLYAAQPDLPEARTKMVYARLRAGVEAEQEQGLSAAERHYHAGLAIEPAHPELLGRLGLVLLRQRRPVEAIDPLERFHRVQSGGGPSALLLGQAYAAAGRLDEARRTLQAGADLADRSGDATTAQRCRELLQKLR